MKKLNPTPSKKTFNDKLKAISAMGAAFLATAPAAEANIVYTDIPDITLNTLAQQQIDIDGDMVTDLTVGAYYGWLGSFAATAKPAPGNAMIGFTGYGTLLMPYPLYSGFPIGPSYAAYFLPSYTYNHLIRNTSNSGYWTAPTTGFLGVRFQIGGNTHYGWVELTVNTSSSAGHQVIIHGYAYEDTPNTLIPAGPTTLAPPSAVPTMSEWGLINLGLLLLTFGTLFIRRMRKTLGLKVATVENDEA